MWVQGVLCVLGVCSCRASEQKFVEDVILHAPPSICVLLTPRWLSLLFPFVYGVLGRALVSCF